MAVLITVLACLLLAVVIAVVSGPLRAADRRVELEAKALAEGETLPEEGTSMERMELETAREAKYREIRDAELDFRTGKLSRADYDTIDADLRAEALGILDRLQAIERADSGGEAVSEGGTSAGS